MKEIYLSNSPLRALVDDEDYEKVKEFTWFLCGNQVQCYKEGHTWGLGEMIIGYSPGLKVDHIDRNGLNNTRTNLRHATQQQNGCNRPKNKNNTSGFKGVFQTDHGYRAMITVQRKRFHLGYFSSPERAAEAYDLAAIKHHGEFACLNFPSS